MRINDTNPIYVEFASINSKKRKSRSYFSYTSPILNGEKKSGLYTKELIKLPISSISGRTFLYTTHIGTLSKYTF